MRGNDPGKIGVDGSLEKDINLEIYPGEKILIAGPSGCGKSTMTHCMNGLIPFAYPGESTGKLTIQGKETKHLSIFEISRMVGTVLQDLDVLHQHDPIHVPPQHVFQAVLDDDDCGPSRED